MYFFPLIFVYTGIWMSSPLISTLSLALGIFGWTIFNVLIFKSLVLDLKKLKDNHSKIIRHGKPVSAKILDKFVKSTRKDGTESIEIDIEFENFSSTIVRNRIDAEDTKPYENRFEVGKTLAIRLNPEGELPLFVIEGSSMEHKKSKAFTWIIFNVVYSVIIFIVSYKFLSRGFGWRFLSPWFPWVIIPYLAILLTRTLGVLGNSSYLSKKLNGARTAEDSAKLLLYGKKTIANITKADQTGMFINDQPEISYRINFTDENNQQHQKSFKKIVLLTDLYKNQLGEREILYLPGNSDVLELL